MRAFHSNEPNTFQLLRQWSLIERNNNSFFHLYRRFTFRSSVNDEAKVPSRGTKRRRRSVSTACNLHRESTNSQSTVIILRFESRKMLNKIFSSVVTHPSKYSFHNLTILFSLADTSKNENTCKLSHPIKTGSHKVKTSLTK
jgi:hypothetical protein